MNKLIFLSCILCSSLTIIAQTKIEKWDLFEVTLNGPAAGNPFMSTTLTGKFTNRDKVYEQEGYYDGNGTYKIRFMPDKEGSWSYVTTSNKTELNNKKGSFECTKASPDNHGPVRVKGKYHFQYDDSTAFYPFGTTIYEWPFQDEATKKETVATLKSGPFNKARFLAVPPYKERYINGPLKITVFPFEGTNRDNWIFHVSTQPFLKTWMNVCFNCGI